MALVQLKVKIKSLAAESTIIRKEERKRAKRKGIQRSPEVIAERASLQAHRRGVVREEARCSLLAYGYLRGMRYRAMEAKCYQPPLWEKVESIARRFRPAGANDVDIKAWLGLE